MLSFKGPDHCPSLSSGWSKTNTRRQKRISLSPVVPIVVYVLHDTHRNILEQVIDGAHFQVSANTKVISCETSANGRSALFESYEGRDEYLPTGWFLKAQVTGRQTARHWHVVLLGSQLGVFQQREPRIPHCAQEQIQRDSLQKQAARVHRKTTSPSQKFRNPHSNVQHLYLQWKVILLQVPGVSRASFFLALAFAFMSQVTW